MQNTGKGPRCTYMYGGVQPALTEGSLLAIPALAAGAITAHVHTEPGRQIKAALTDYGGYMYIVDGTGDGNSPRGPRAATCQCMDAAVNAEMVREFGYAMTYPMGVTNDPKFGKALYLKPGGDLQGSTRR